jgi:23S rRNA pseudouridine2605 synthase
MIAAGRVTVDGETVTDPARDVGACDPVALDGRLLDGPQAPVVLALNKPVGVISTARDTHGRPTVTDLVELQGVRLYPVGRLDADSRGLILLTNDGDLANRLTHPRYEVAKTYRARLAGAPIGETALRSLRAGVTLEDGPTGPAEVRRISAREIELTIREGRNRQVRRMCEAVGHRVLELERTAIGGLALGDLPPGGHRRLSEAEVERLRSSGGG